MLSVAAWLIVLAIGVSVFMVVIGNPVIDWLDARTSRLTPEEARERARLNLAGRWPTPKTTWQKARPALLAWVIMGLLYLLYRLSW